MKTRNGPEVRHGVATPGDFEERMRSAHAESELKPKTVEKKPASRGHGRVVRFYQSRMRKYRISLRRHSTRYLPDGEKVEEPRRTAQGNSFDVFFDGGIFRTSDPELIEALDASNRFGIYRDYWDAEAVRFEADKREAEEIAERLANDPQFADRLRVAIGKTDHAVAPTAPPSPE